MNHRTKQKGFTTIEMLVIIGVLSLLSATLLVYSRAGERQITLFREQAKIVSILTRAKSLSVAAFGKIGVPCGYGVHFETPRTYLIFKDLADDCSLADKKYSGTSEIFESFQLDSSLTFDILTLTDIIFIPPDPAVILDNDFSKTEALIKIKTINGNDEKIIKINNGGQITI